MEEREGVREGGGAVSGPIPSMSRKALMSLDPLFLLTRAFFFLLIKITTDYSTRET